MFFRSQFKLPSAKVDSVLLDTLIYLFDRQMLVINSLDTLIKSIELLIVLDIQS